MSRVTRLLKAIGRLAKRAFVGSNQDDAEGSHFQPGFYIDITGGAKLPVREDTTPEWEHKDLGI